MIAISHQRLLLQQPANEPYGSSQEEPKRYVIVSYHPIPRPKRTLPWQLPLAKNRKQRLDGPQAVKKPEMLTKFLPIYSHNEHPVYRLAGSKKM